MFLQRLFASAEIKFIPLSVMPYDEEVDMGGLRLLIVPAFIAERLVTEYQEKRKKEASK